MKCAQHARWASRPLRCGRWAPKIRLIWNIWDKPSTPNIQKTLEKIPPGNDINYDGEGDILRITGVPHPGSRTIDMDAENQTATDEHMQVYPQPYTIEYYGYHPDKVALSFDDGPDPKWTPKILDILKAKHVKGAFMVIGEQAQDNVGLLRRYIREGHEIGNHTYTHPDISEIPTRQVELELNLTERLFASKLGIKPLYFRPPYSIDQEPDTNDQAAPAYRIQQMGYTIVGDKIDTDDWNEHPRKTPQEITWDVLEQLRIMKTKPQFRGSIILLHDGGGDRSVTVAALPVLIDTLRAHGYQIVPVSELMGKTTAEVMPPLTPQSALAGARRFRCIHHVRLRRAFHRHDLFHRRCADECAARAHRSVRRHRSPAPSQGAGSGRRFCPARSRTHSRLQRREGDRANDPLGAQFGL